MILISVIFKVLLVSFTAIMMSVLANVTAKGIGIDIKDIKQRTNPKFLFLAVVFNLLFILAVAVILKWIDGKNIRVLNWRLNITGIMFSLCAVLITFIIAFGFIGVLHKRKLITVKYVSKNLRAKNLTGFIVKLLGFSVLFLAALQEEVMFRGYLGTVLRIYGTLSAMIITSVIFTAWHFITNKVSLFQAADWFLGGIMLFFVYAASGSIWVAAIVHFSRNFANVLAFNILNENSLVVFDRPVTPFYKTVYTSILSIAIIFLTYLYYGSIRL